VKDPSRLLTWILDAFCPWNRPDLKGDFLELYEDRVVKIGRFQANKKLLWDVISIIPMNLASKSKSSNLMFKNYLVTAIRSFSRNKLTTTINVMGLSLGILTSFIILNYVYFERSYDDFLQDSESIYRVALDMQIKNGVVEKSAQNYPALGPALKTDYEEVLDYCRLYYAPSGANTCTISYVAEGENVIHNTRSVYFADASFFSIFSFPLVSGNETALEEPNSIVLSKRKAITYFGKVDDILGIILEVSIDGDVNEYVITGIVEDLPANSHFNFDFLLSYSTLNGPWYQDAWDWNEFYTYVLLAPNTDILSFEKNLLTFINTHLAEKHKKYGMSESFIFQPLEEIHLESNLAFEMEKNGDSRMINLLIIIAFAVLFFAWSNYINLSLAVSIKRYKEVGIRKILGASKSKIINQLIVEFSALVSIAVLISLLMFFTIQPLLTEYFGINFLNITENNRTWISILSLIIVGSYLTGIFPAFLLSFSKPILVLKGYTQSVRGGKILKKVLTTSQFVLSIIMIAGTISVFQQIRLLEEQELGMKIEDILVINAPNYSYEDTTYQQTYDSFKKEILRHSSYLDITSSSSVPGTENNWSLSGVIRKSNVPREQAATYYFVEFDYNYIDFFKLNMVAGRDFSEDFTSKIPTVIINETAGKLLGFENPENAVGQRIVMDQNGDDLDYSMVVGVVNDFRQEYGKNEILPTIYWTHTGINLYYCLKLSSGESTMQSVNMAKSIWEKFYPEHEFDYFFLEDFYKTQIQSELTFQKSFTIFTYLALIISCLGLLGMSILSGARRFREIGIRKVFGASSINILKLLSRDFVNLIVISNIIGLPIVYWLIQQWLNNYTTRIELGWWFYFAPGIILIIITITVLSYQLTKSVQAKPFEILRYE